MSAYTARVNCPDFLKGDDNTGNVYAVFFDGKHVGYVHRVLSSRSWVLSLPDGGKPARMIDATTMRYAAELLAEVAA